MSRRQLDRALDERVKSVVRAAASGARVEVVAASERVAALARRGARRVWQRGIGGHVVDELRTAEGLALDDDARPVFGRWRRENHRAVLLDATGSAATLLPVLAEVGAALSRALDATLFVFDRRMHFVPPERRRPESILAELERRALLDSRAHEPGWTIFDFVTIVEAAALHRPLDFVAIVTDFVVPSGGQGPRVSTDSLRRVSARARSVLLVDVLPAELLGEHERTSAEVTLGLPLADGSDLASWAGCVWHEAEPSDASKGRALRQGDRTLRVSRGAGWFQSQVADRRRGGRAVCNVSVVAPVGHGAFRIARPLRGRD